MIGLAARLFDSERKVLEVLWDRGESPAREIARVLGEEIGWSKTTTYTVIKKCLDKGVIGRSEPGFICRALVSRQDARARETDELIDRFYGGAADMLVASLLDRKALNKAQLARLRKLVGEYDGDTP